MRIFTCTPINFSSKGFFERDSGLLCKGLQQIGMESRAIMPGDPSSEVEADLIRTEYENLESVDWWKSLGLQGVVLYAWGRPRFTKVAQAIHEAGIFLILNQDSAALMSPQVGLGKWLKASFVYTGQGRGTKAWLRLSFHVIRGLTYQYFIGDRLRGEHLALGDRIGCVSPIALERYRKLSQGTVASDRFLLMPHAVSSRFRYHGEPKQSRIVCVARWDDVVQKRAWLMMRVMEYLLERDQDVSVAIAGKATKGMLSWHERLRESVRERILLAGDMSRDQISDLLLVSSVFYSPSAYESFSIAAAEALCAGCSVVSAKKITLPSFEWFVSENSGTLAENDEASSHVDAITKELDLWQGGGRDAVRISKIWCERLHADRIASQIISLCDENELP